MQGELTSRLSSSWMLYRIYNLIVWFVFAPLLMNWRKGGEVFGFIYACCLYLLFMHICLQKKGKKYLNFIDLFMHICCLVYALYWIYICLYAMHELRGSLTSSLMHCILCFMWVRVLSSFLHLMHVCRGS